MRHEPLSEIVSVRTVYLSSKRLFVNSQKQQVLNAPETLRIQSSKISSKTQLEMNTISTSAWGKLSRFNSKGEGLRPKFMPKLAKIRNICLTKKKLQVNYNEDNNNNFRKITAQLIFFQRLRRRCSLP